MSGHLWQGLGLPQSIRNICANGCVDQGVLELLSC